ncbi:MAG TPA: hypothetical protein VF960_15015 [Chloroflexota bacterium]
MDMFKSQTFAVLMASGLAAGILGFAFARRSAESRRERMGVLPSWAMMEKARDLGDTELAKVGREFFNDRVVPEMKPVLIDLLKEFEGYTDRYFRKAEKAIKAI